MTQLMVIYRTRLSHVPSNKTVSGWLVLMVSLQVADFNGL
jgi:hypothetical protein